MCVCFFWLLLLVLVHFCSECNRVWFRLFQSTSQGNKQYTSTQPQVESFENTIEPKTFVLYLYWTWFALNPAIIIYWSKLPLAFRPSCKVCVSDTFQASIFFDGRKGWILFPIQVWLWLCSLAIWRFCLDASFAEFNTKLIFLHALMQILHECSSCEGLGSSTERVLSRDEKR